MRVSPSVGGGQYAPSPDPLGDGHTSTSSSLINISHLSPCLWAGARPKSLPLLHWRPDGRRVTVPARPTFVGHRMYRSRVWSAEGRAAHERTGFVRHHLSSVPCDQVVPNCVIKDGRSLCRRLWRLTACYSRPWPGTRVVSCSIRRCDLRSSSAKYAFRQMCGAGPWSTIGPRHGAAMPPDIPARSRSPRHLPAGWSPPGQQPIYPMADRRRPLPRRFPCLYRGPKPSPMSCAGRIS